MQSKTLEIELTDILRGIYKYFEGIIDNKENDVTEQLVKSALKNYLQTATTELDSVQEELVKIKAKYDGVEIKEEEE